MVRNKMHVKKGDLVAVIAGKYKGKRGKVIRVVPHERRVVVEGVNMVKKHQRPQGQLMQGGIINQEAPIHGSNVMLVCPRCDEPVRSGHKILENGAKVRVCAQCDEVVDQ